MKFESLTFVNCTQKVRHNIWGVFYEKENKKQILMKYTIIFSVILIIGCVQHNKQKKEYKQKELIIDTNILRSLQDSLNSTGDQKYYNKYLDKINEMIKKYPDQKQLLKVKKSMSEIYG